MSSENVVRLKGDHIRDSLEGLLLRDMKDELLHFVGVAVLKNGDVLTVDAWQAGGSRPYTIVGDLEDVKRNVLGKTE